MIDQTINDSEMKNYFLFFIIVTLSCNGNATKNERLINALTDSTMTTRGNIIKISQTEFRFDYYDVHEKDSDLEILEKMKYQGGGYSWEGIVYGAIKLSDENLLNEIRFDPEAEGLAIWSNNEESLKKVGRLIAVIKSDDKILLDCIERAKKNWKME